MSAAYSRRAALMDAALGGGRRRRSRRGGRLMDTSLGGAGFFDSIKKGLKFIKDNQLASKALSLADATGLTGKLSGSKFGNLALGALGKAKELGYGRRRRRRAVGGSKSSKKRVYRGGGVVKF